MGQLNRLAAMQILTCPLVWRACVFGIRDFETPRIQAMDLLIYISRRIRKQYRISAIYSTRLMH